MHLKLIKEQTIISIRAYSNLFTIYSQIAEIILSTLDNFLCFK